MTGIAAGAAFLAGAAVGWSAIAAVALALATAVAVAGNRRLLPAAAVAALAGVGGAWRGEPPPTVPAPTWADAAVVAHGRVANDPAVTGRAQGFVLALAEVDTGDERLVAGGSICVWGPAHPEVGLGDRVEAAGEVVPVADVAPRLRPYLRQKGCAATMDAHRLVVDAVGRGWRRQLALVARRLSSVVQDGVPGDEGILLSGLVTGNDHAFSRERRDAFLVTGTSHVTAVSGANVALLVTICATLGSGAGWRRRFAWQGATVGLVWTYAVLAGAAPPALRAALVATGAIMASRFGRRADCVTLVVLAAAAMVAIDPVQIWRLSFQLSLAASLALAAVVPSLAPVGVFGWLRAGLVVSLAAQLATLPLLLPLDGRVSSIALPANLVVGPLVDAAFPLAAMAALAGLAWPPLGELLLIPAWLCARAVLAIVDALANVPEAAPLGTVSRPLLLLLTGAMAVAVVALSEEGRTWLERLPHDARRAAPRLRVVAGGATGGAIVVALARWFG